MTMKKQEKTETIREMGTKYGKGAQDTGLPAVQIALLTKRINNLRPHFSKHIHDYHSNRGLMKMIGQRKALLKYLQRKNVGQYQTLIKDLGLRK